MAKPGDTRKSSTGAMQIWTGRAWVPVPRLKAQQQAQRKQIAEANARGTWVQEWWKAATSMPDRKPANAERSWKSRGTQSGTVGSAISRAKPSGSSDRTPSSGFTGATGKDISSTSKPVLLGGGGKKNPKATTPKPSTATKPSAAGSRSSSRPKPSKPSAMGGGRKPSVSQSNTEWVKAGTMVNGKEVKKGYLAQKGKPERRVTANVRAVKGNAAGMKAGSVTRYKAGRKVKKK